MDGFRWEMVINCIVADGAVQATGSFETAGIKKLVLGMAPLQKL